MPKEKSARVLTETDIAEAKELDQRLVDAFNRKDLDAAMQCFWNDPDVVVVLNGNVCSGPDAVRAALKAMLDQNESIAVEVNEITHITSGDGVIGIGTATFDLEPLGGPRKLLVERWSDVRKKIDGRWVMVLDHTTHLPE